MNALDDSANTDRCTLYEDSANFLKDDRFAKLWQNIRPRQTFERWTSRTQELPHELARQSEAKRKQAPQSEANVCRRRRRKCNLKKPPLLIAQDTQKCTGHPRQIRGCILVPRTQKVFIPIEELQDISHFTPKGSLISRKTTYLRGALNESLGKVLLPRPSIPS